MQRAFSITKDSVQIESASFLTGLYLEVDLLSALDRTKACGGIESTKLSGPYFSGSDGSTISIVIGINTDWEGEQTIEFN